MPHAEGLRLAILINEFSKQTQPMKDAYAKILATVEPSTTIEFFDPINAQEYPDVTKFDLIVLSGGSVFVMEEVPWVMKMRAFINSTVEDHPTKKIMGICWGHQIINVALGGIVKEMGSADVGVHTIALTEKGSEFFGPDVLQRPGEIKIQQFHKRDVQIPAAGLVPLAKNNESFVNENNTIITFQGHPEMNVEWAYTAASGFPAYIALTGYTMEEILESVKIPTDGEAIWRRVLAWVRE
ncbi:putative copper/iron-regulated glutamine amidotransferase [Thozetella sp. PMI_491]|nr:putative copper/iron-regulated glutamine amidotransferase [Thozetella sp. PMI_491]